MVPEFSKTNLLKLTYYGAKVIAVCYVNIKAKLFHRMERRFVIRL